MTTSRNDAGTGAHFTFAWQRPHHWIAYGLGAGLSPWAPGTAGTLVGVALYLLVQPLPLGWYLAVLVGGFSVGVWACGKTASELRTPDPGAIVWDEVVGYLVTMTALPADWPWVLGGFALFRLFDIWKPWPIRVLDTKVGGGLGIMLDDVAAGVLAWAVLQGVALFVA
jgi:phosphatidylglycerophosphatase A